MKRKIAIFTGTRAEYGLMRRLIKELASREDVDPVLIVSGSHLAKEYGGTIDEILADNFVKAHKIDIGLSDNSPTGVAAASGRGLSLYAEFLDSWRPDLLVLLGDRYETFVAASAATLCRVPLAHIHGGEITEGAIDDALRHAITKMSHLHFTSCEAYRNRVVQMGENPDRVWVSGSLGVENIRKLPRWTSEKTRKELDLPANAPYVIATWHPVTLSDQESAATVRHIIDAIMEYPDLFCVFTGANADAGGKRINDCLIAEAEHNRRLRFFMSLGAQRYIMAAAYSRAVLGNSSSGLCELPGMGVPILDIGDRQKGRLRPQGVLHCDPDPESIGKGVGVLLSREFSEVAKNAVNPLEKPDSAFNIATIITKYPLDKLRRKIFWDLPMATVIP